MGNQMLNSKDATCKNAPGCLSRCWCIILLQSLICLLGDRRQKRLLLVWCPLDSVCRKTRQEELDRIEQEEFSVTARIYVVFIL
mmetsp:Transcript_26357/g.39195  ORF Transcript_26357/g.39195 Transcript_26357/m.39195 type:complete len:84 (+) Transcript_26357:78-329(+)